MAQKFFAGTFKQRVRTFYGQNEGLEGKVKNLCTLPGGLLAATDKGIFSFDNGAFHRISAETASGAYTCGDKTYICRENLLYELKDNSLIEAGEFDSRIIGIASDNMNIWLATADRLYKSDGEKFVFYSKNDRSGMRLMTAFGNGRVYQSDGRNLAGLWGKRPRWGSIMSENSDLPSCSITALHADGIGSVWLGTDKGAYIFDGKSSWFGHSELDFLPAEAVNALCLDEQSGKVFFGTDGGLYVISGTRRSFLSGGRWLPSPRVTCLACDGEGGVWAGTENGIAHLEMISMTLEEKAAHFEELADKYNKREGYFVPRALTEPGNIESGAPMITDNDGLWTANYIVSEACRYAVTGEDDALNKARASFKALIRLHDVTGIPGFPARAYRRPGEPGYGNGDPEWHLTNDDRGELEWLGETSSDEIMGHFFGLSYYRDLIADENEKELIAQKIKAMADHIITHNYTVCDADGLPTTWGRWSPELLNRDDMWRWERGVNSLELLTVLKTAFVVTNDRKYDDLYYGFIENEKYAINSARHKMRDGHSNHVDDHLSTYVTLTILRYEKNPAVLRYLLAGLKDFWNYERIERCPYWSVLFGAFSDECCDLDRAVQSLKELPLDLINYPVKNSFRELEWTDDAVEYGGVRQLKEPLPYDEKPVNGYDSNPFTADGGNALEAAEPTIFLLPYWLGRYFGLLGD